MPTGRGVLSIGFDELWKRTFATTPFTGVTYDKIDEFGSLQDAVATPVAANNNDHVRFGGRLVIDEEGAERKENLVGKDERREAEDDENEAGAAC